MGRAIGSPWRAVKLLGGGAFVLLFLVSLVVLIALPVDWTPAFVSPQGTLRYDAAKMQAIVDVVAPTKTASFVEQIDVSRGTSG